jgi:hypothetical protein
MPKKKGDYYDQPGKYDPTKRDKPDGWGCLVMIGFWGAVSGYLSLAHWIFQ